MPSSGCVPGILTSFGTTLAPNAACMESKQTTASGARSLVRLQRIDQVLIRVVSVNQGFAIFEYSLLLPLP
jgi:hypothetical protein